MSSDLKLPLEDITETYRAEYYEKASAEQKGWLGKLNRFLNKLPGHDKAESRFFTTALAVGVPLFVLSMLLPVLTLPAVIALTGAAVATSLVSHATACKASARSMTQDIANGTLGKRYANEILKPRNDQSYDAVIEKLCHPLNLQDKAIVTAFNACAADVSESPPLDQKPSPSPAIKK